MGAWVSRAVVLVSLVLLAGCADTLKYAGPIDRFAEATRQAEQAIRRFAEPRPGERERLVAAALANPGNLAVPDSECRTDAAGCELRVKGQDGIERRLSGASSAPQTLALLADLSAYAADLKRIAIANREQDIRVALGSVTESVGSVAQVFGKRVSPDAEIGNQLIAFLVNAYLNELKLDALREATTMMEAALPEQAEFLNAMGGLLTEREIGIAFTRYQAARNDFRLSAPPVPVARLEALEASAKELDGLLKLRASLEGDNASVFKSMRAAHAKLHKALHDDDSNSFDGALAEIDFFLREAERLAGIVGQLE